MNSIRYDGKTYFFNVNEEDSYYYEPDEYLNVIRYKATDCLGVEYTIEYRLLGQKDIVLARKLVLQNEHPWDVIRLGPNRHVVENRFERVSF